MSLFSKEIWFPLLFPLLFPLPLELTSGKAARPPANFALFEPFFSPGRHFSRQLFSSPRYLLQSVSPRLHKSRAVILLEIRESWRENSDGHFEISWQLLCVRFSEVSTQWECGIARVHCVWFNATCDMYAYSWYLIWSVVRASISKIELKRVSCHDFFRSANLANQVFCRDLFSCSALVHLLRKENFSVETFSRQSSLQDSFLVATVPFRFQRIITRSY